MYNDWTEPYNLVQPPDYVKYESITSKNPVENEIKLDDSNPLDRLQTLIYQTKQNKDQNQNENYLLNLNENNFTIPSLNVSDLVSPSIINTTDTESHSSTNAKKTKFTSHKQFVDKMKPIIQSELQKQGISINYTNDVLSHMALESDWGHNQSGANNLAGLQAYKGGVSLTTTEYINGKKIKTKANFMEFNTLQQFVEYYINRLKNKFKAFNGGDYVTNIKKRGYFTAPLSDYKLGFNRIKRQINEI